MPLHTGWLPWESVSMNSVVWSFDSLRGFSFCAFPGLSSQPACPTMAVDIFDRLLRLTEIFLARMVTSYINPRLPRRLNVSIRRNNYRDVLIVSFSVFVFVRALCSDCPSSKTCLYNFFAVTLVAQSSSQQKTVDYSWSSVRYGQ